MAKFCRECGAALNEGAKFCPSCGVKILQTVQPPSEPVQPAPQGQRQPQPPQQQTTQPPRTVNRTEEFLAQKRREQAEQAQTAPAEKRGNKEPVQRGNAGEQGTGGPARSGNAGNQGAGRSDQPGSARDKKQTGEEWQTGAETRKQKKSKKPIVITLVALLLVGAFLFTAFAVPGFLRSKPDGETPGGGGGGGKTSRPAVVKTESASISKDQPAATLCGVTVDVVPEMLGTDSRQLSVSKLEDTTEDGVRCENYDLNIGTHERFDVPVEVTFPCKISAGVDPTVEHYNSETKRWDPLISIVDESKGTVTACFGSFSEARVSYLPVGVDPRIYRVVENKENKFAPEIGLASNYWKILQRIDPAQYSDEVTRFINDPDNYSIDVPELDPNMDAKAAYEAFTKSNTIWTFMDPLINLGINELPSQGQNAVVKFIADHSEKLSNAMSVVPFIMMSAQVAFDLSSGEPDAAETAAVNLYKNLITSSGTIYSLTTGYSHIGFTLAFFGVALFGMELDYLVDAAKAEQKANVKSVFDSYYTNTAPFDAYHWYKVFEDAYWDNDGNAEAAMRAVKKAVDDYCTQFWDKIYSSEGSDAFWEALSDSEYRKIFMNATAEDKAMLTEQQKARVWNMIQKHSMKIIRRFMLEQLQTDTGKQLYQVVEAYNREKTITIQENVNRGAEAVLTGYTVCLGYDFVPFPGWHVNIPEDEELKDGWTTGISFTVYGYMKMGMPNQVQFYLDEEEFQEATQGKERPSYMFAFDLDPDSKDPSTLVEFNFGDPYQAKSDSFTGYEWMGTISYGGEISSSHVNGAIQDAIRKMSFKLDKDGNFNVSGSGSSSKSGSGEPGPNDSYSYSANATVTLKGHIDRSNGDGTFEVSISVSYHHTTGSPYSGTDKVSATVTIKSDGAGKINGEIDTDGYFDPVFTGDVKVKRQGSWSHSKGSAEWDHDGHETINTTEERSCKFIFLSNN